MSAQITDIAAALHVPAADVMAIVNQLSEIDYDDTVDPEPHLPLNDTIECPDGTYRNAYLTPSAIAALFSQFNGDPDVAFERFGVTVR